MELISYCTTSPKSMVQEVKLAKKGDKEAFTRLIKTNQTSMYRVAKAITGSDDDSADVIQEAIIKAYKNITNVKNDEHFKTWLIKIVINESRRLLRANSKVLDSQGNEISYRDGTGGVYSPEDKNVLVYKMDFEGISEIPQTLTVIPQEYQGNDLVSREDLKFTLSLKQ